MKNQARTTLLLSLIVGTFLVACGGATTSTPGDVSLLMANCRRLIQLPSVGRSASPAPRRYFP
jgi:hypothetical protein